MADQFQIQTTATCIHRFGLDEELLLYNPSTNSGTIYVDGSQNPSAVQGTPIAPGSSVQWAPGKPLYAISPSGVEVLTVSAEAGNLTSAVDVANALVASNLAGLIAQQIALQGVPAIDVPASVPDVTVVNGFDVTKYASVTVDIQITAVGGPSPLKDIWSATIYGTNANVTGAVIGVVTGHSSGYARLTIPTAGWTKIQILFAMQVNTSGLTYVFKSNLGTTPVPASLSFRPQPFSFWVQNLYWFSHYLSGLDANDGNSCGALSLTNSTVTMYPNYRRGANGQTQIGLLLNSTGSAGATFEFAVQDAISGVWLTGVLSNPATVAAINQFSCTLTQQPAVFLKTTSTTAQTYQYSQYTAA